MTATVSKITNREFFSGKTVLVMGLGRFGGGVDVAKFAVAGGAKVIVTDSASPEKLSDSIEQLAEFPAIEFHLGSHDPADFENADVVVANPAVAPDNKFLEIARRCGKCVTSQMNIFFELCPATIIGITGANGKSTTTALTAHLLRSAFAETLNRASSIEYQASNIKHRASSIEHQASSIEHQASSIEHRASSIEHRASSIEHRVSSTENVWLSGNIGDRPLLATIDQITPADLVVLELSSFQLEQLAQIERAPKIALLTNLTPNHLDRHGTFENYCAAKQNIFKFQNLDKNSPAVSIFNADDEIGAEWFEKYKSDPGRLCIKFSADDVPPHIRRAFPLPGRANLSNLAAALAVAGYFRVPDNLIAACLPEFKPLPHRLELVAEINGVRWYNDSIATTPPSAIAALDAFDCPRIIIAGGYDKNLPFDELGEKIAATAKAAILIGRTAQKIADAIRSAQAAPAVRNPQVSLRALDLIPGKCPKENGPSMSLRGAKRRSNLKERDTRYEIRDTKVEFAASLAEAVDLADCLAERGDVVLLSPACASYDMFDNFQHRGRQFADLVRDIRKRL
jgi:UDP-N-acetylmuramoylalanine--D-glutamate ligase